MTAKVLVLIAMLGVAGEAGADVIYSYVGKTYTDIVDLPRPGGTFDMSMRVTGTFVLADALAPGTPLTDIAGLVTSFTFSNGRDTLSSLDSSLTLPLFSVGTDASGAIDAWSISVQQLETLGALGTDIIIQTINDPGGPFEVQDLGQLDVCSEFDPQGICRTLADVATVGATAGGWIRTAPEPIPEPAVPEPATLGLCAIGLGALARRRALNKGLGG